MSENTSAPELKPGQQTDKTKLFYLAFFSYAMFVGCYLIYNCIYMGVTSIVAGYFQIPTEIHYWKTTFDIPLWWWNQPNVICTFSSGPVFSAILGIVCLRFFFLFRKGKNWKRLFFLWGYHHGFNLFFGAYVAGVISRSGFRHASNWAAIPVEIEYFIAIGAMVCMFLVGFLSVKFFLQMAISQSLLLHHKRNKFITAMVFTPWFFGSLTMIAMKTPMITYNEALIFLMMFTSVVPVYIAQRFFYEVSIVRFEKNLRINWISVAALGLFLLSFRYVLDDGIFVSFHPEIVIRWINH
jgi:hypothetical protein